MRGIISGMGCGGSSSIDHVRRWRSRRITNSKSFCVKILDGRVTQSRSSESDDGVACHARY